MDTILGRVHSTHTSHTYSTYVIGAEKDTRIVHEIEMAYGELNNFIDLYIFLYFNSTVSTDGKF